MAKRIYRIELKNNVGAASEEFLVNANNQSQALRSVAQYRYGVELASQADLVRLVASGTKVIEAGAEGDQE